MKHSFFILPLIAGIVANQSFAQQQQTSDGRMITTAIDVVESNLDRTVVYGEGSTDRGAVTINNAGASYTGTDVNLSYTGGTNTLGYYLQRGKSLILKTSGEDVRNTVTLSGSPTSTVRGVNIENVSEKSYISNTDINLEGGSAFGLYSAGDLELDDVNIHTSLDSGGHGIRAYNSHVTNEGKGQVTITADFTGTGENVQYVAIESLASTVDFHDATISVARTGASPEGSNIYGVLTVQASGSRNGSISLTNSRISSADGNLFATIAGSGVGFSGTIDLDGVNLDNAKNQAILHLGEGYLNLSNGTNYDGYIQDYEAIECNLALTITSGASWNVTQDSTTGTTGSLSLGAGSTISFVELSEGTFTNITSASIALEAGAILMLGATADEIQALIDGNEGTYNVNLFTTDQSFSNDGVVLVTSDGQELEYTTDNQGNYTLKGILPVSIPEPTTASFGLAALGLLALRRRK